MSCSIRQHCAYLSLGLSDGIAINHTTHRNIQNNRMCGVPDVVRLGAVPQRLGLVGVLIVVVRGWSAGWTQLRVVRGGADDLVELVVEGFVGVGSLIMLDSMVVKR